MCGRFSLGADTDRLVAEFGLGAVSMEHRPRFNIAPGQQVAAVVLGDEGLRLGTLQWGLVPARVSGRSPVRPLINARAETAATKPAFRSAFRRRRCWILADGFYEWRRGPGGRKVPFHFSLPDGAPFAMAGLWERAGTPDGDLLTCTILTTEANDVVRPVHDRMPVLLGPGDRAHWLPPDSDPHVLGALLRPWDADLVRRQVSDRVNSTRNDDPACTTPVTPDLPLPPDPPGGPAPAPGETKPDTLV